MSVGTDTGTSIQYRHVALLLNFTFPYDLQIDRIL